MKDPLLNTLSKLRIGARVSFVTKVRIYYFLFEWVLDFHSSEGHSWVDRRLGHAEDLKVDTRDFLSWKSGSIGLSVGN